MKTLKFKTTINCGACLAKVTPKLDAAAGVEKWAVDLKDPARTLTVEGGDELEAEAVTAAVKGAGFRAEVV